MGAEKDGHTVEENDTVGNGGEEGPFVLESEHSKKNGRGDIPSVAELSPKGMSRFATKEWNLTNGKEHSVIESEKKELAVGSGGDDNHTVEEKVPTELPGCTVNELKLTIEKEHSVVNVIEHLLTTEYMNRSWRMKKMTQRRPQQGPLDLLQKKTKLEMITL